MKVRWTPGSLRFPALKGRLIVDTYRGQMRVRAWPRKRGPSKSAEVRRQNQWFKEALALMGKVAPTQSALAIRMTLGTGLYPRDLLMRQMSGGIYDIIDEDGRNYKVRQRFRETKVFQGVILELAVMKTFTANIASFVTWPLPVLDTLGFWDVTQPDRIIIPEGINVVEVTAGLAVTPNGARLLTSIFKTALPLAGESSVIGQNLVSGQAFSGPIPVVVNDIFRLRGFCNATRTTDANRRQFLALNVLDAD
jgi:hypothetical protein